MKRFILIVLVSHISLCLFSQNLNWDEVAIVKTDNVNMRKLPSASSQPLGYISTGSDEEHSCGFIYDLIWKPNTVKNGKFVNMQLMMGDVYRVIEQQGDWVKIDYICRGQSCQPWVMSKFVEIEKIKPLYCGITFSEDNDWCNGTLAILSDGRAIYNLESDPDTDGGIFFGNLKDGKVVIDRYVSGEFISNESIDGINIEEDPDGGYDSGYIKVYWGKALKNPKYKDFSSLFLSKITPEMYNSIYSKSKAIDTPLVLFLAPGGYIIQIQ